MVTMTDHDTTIREAREYRDAITSGDVITVQIKSTTKPLVLVDPDKLSGMLEALLAVIEQQAETLRQVREPLQSLADTLAFSTRDWGTARDLSWLWGILQGWDDDDPQCDAMPEQAACQGWDANQVARLRGFHATITRILDAGGDQ